MQSKSIHKPACIENTRTSSTFPASGDNFVTVLKLDNQADTLALLEAMEFLDDYLIAMAAFEADRYAVRHGISSQGGTLSLALGIDTTDRQRLPDADHRQCSNNRLIRQRQNETMIIYKPALTIIRIQYYPRPLESHHTQT